MKAFLFPGQGSQVKGMGGELFDHFSTLTGQADEILGYSIKALCLDDPGKELGKTQFTQPALYVVNALSYFKRMEESGGKADFVAGHSLGEFNALLAAQCFDFETGLKLVKKRGELMSQAPAGGMAAILNASKEQVEAILQDNGLTRIDLANYNTPSQVVISGAREDIVNAQPLFQGGEMLYYFLNTSGAFHSRYMQTARDEFEVYLKTFEFSDPQIPVIANISAKPYESDEIIKNLANQVTGSVKWSESIQYLMGLADVEFEELGPGDVLTKLVAKIQKETGQQAIEKITADKPIEALSVGQCSTTEEKVAVWNKNYSIGTKVISKIIDDNSLETRTEATILFGHRAAVYMKGYNGYFDLDELTPA